MILHRSVSASAHAAARAAGVSAVQSSLCAFQCLTWHPRPQYLAVLQTEQGLSLTPSGLESSEAPQLAQTLGATMPPSTMTLTTLVDVTRHSLAALACRQ